MVGVDRLRGVSPDTAAIDKELMKIGHDVCLAMAYPRTRIATAKRTVGQMGFGLPHGLPGSRIDAELAILFQKFKLFVGGTA